MLKASLLYHFGPINSIPPFRAVAQGHKKQRLSSGIYLLGAGHHIPQGVSACVCVCSCVVSASVVAHTKTEKDRDKRKSAVKGIMQKETAKTHTHPYTLIPALKTHIEHASKLYVLTMIMTLVLGRRRRKKGKKSGSVSVGSASKTLYTLMHHYQGSRKSSLASKDWKSFNRYLFEGFMTGPNICSRFQILGHNFDK